MSEKESKQMRPSSDSILESDSIKSSTEKIDKSERKERHCNRFELADKLIEVEDFQDHFLKVCIESNMSNKTATTLLDMICA